MSAATSPAEAATLMDRIQKTALWRLKVRLQFTGWLQYIAIALAALVLVGLAGIGRIIGVWPTLLFWTPLAIGALLLLDVVVDISTIKLGIRPPERIPAPLNELDAFDVMRARRACRSFQKRDLTDEHRALLRSSVADWTQPEVLIGDHPIRLEYLAAPLTVWPVVGGREFLVAIAPRDYSRTAIIDVGRSLQHVVIEATRRGLATCWIGPGADHASIIEHLGDRFDPDRDHIVCVCAVGYKSHFTPTASRLMQVSQHRRLPRELLFYSDAAFQRPLDLDAGPFARFGRCFEVCQWSPSSYNSQTTRCVGSLAGVGAGPDRPRFDFYAATASRFYAAVALGIWCANWEIGSQALGLAGRFVALDEAARSDVDAPELPRYDVSWVLA